ncbi:hypothetical protein C8R43DRAFT_680641 [Mycena crocata]|nr:hypothetical protein C8R43DRAFT_680641 [Mycena crocata]
MGRWTQYDEDSYRLPPGMVRTGYDADTGQYYFQDRSGTYAGLPGSEYGPMYSVRAQAPSSSPVVDPASPSVELELSAGAVESKRRATIDVPGAIRSLRRSLTSRVRRPWRRDSSPATDDEEADEEPVMVQRPSSAASKPLLSANSMTSTARSVSTVASAKSGSRRTETRPSKPRISAASPPPKPSKTAVSAPSTTGTTKSTPNPQSPPPPPPKPTKSLSSTTVTRSKSTPTGSKVDLPIYARYASTSLSASRSGRAASESDHVFATRPPSATRSVNSTSKKTSKPLPPTVSPGAANSQPQNIPSNRRASEQTSSSPAATTSPRSTTTSPAPSPPRTSPSLVRAQSVSASQDAPRTSRTIAIALAT